GVRSQESGVRSQESGVRRKKKEKEEYFSLLFPAISNILNPYKMDNLVDSFNHENNAIVNNVKIEIQNQRDNLDDAKDKSGRLLRIIKIATAFTAGAELAEKG
ncbi:hypothetical protein VB713_21795, partial [Anabaena cylindrica UHCC 0172]|nr:hypothetical protein [Anabaena cylindrica UHCC 0172]